MTFNRIVDRQIDARNPRTRTRALPAAVLGLRFAVTFLLIAVAIFEIAAWQLNPLAFKLSPLALAWILLYSYTKRFTAWSHLALGLSLGIAPAAAWIAVRGELSPRILWLTAAVTLWVGGFDILYACQDYDFDCAQPGLHSLPKKMGIRDALRVAAAFHVAVIGCLAVLLVTNHLGIAAWCGLVVVALLLAYEHWLVKPEDLSRINAAFFTVNGYIGILLLVFWGGAILMRRHWH